MNVQELVQEFTKAPIEKRAITNHEFSLTQFQIGQPFWEKYLKGEESDPKKALQAAMDAVAAEVKKAA